LRGLNAQSARFLSGKRVNLHLEDGSVIVNVQITSFRADGKKHIIKYRTPLGEAEIGMKEILRAEPLNPLLLRVS